MKHFALFVVVVATVATFSVLYAPQPILPLLSAEFSTTPSRTALLISVPLLCLGIAPVAYGYVIEAVSPRNLLRVAVALLGLSQAAIALTDGFAAMLAWRTFQGLLIPGIFTSLVTYCASLAAPEQVRRYVAIYIASTILGGFAGRALTGVLASALEWRWVFFGWAVLLFVVWLLLLRLPPGVGARREVLSFALVRKVMREPVFKQIYLLIFIVFFVFASILNYLPFRLKEVDAGISELAIGLAYGGYLIGIAIALGSTRIAVVVGGESRAVIAGMILCVLGTAMLLVAQTAVIYGAIFVLCAGMFLVHSLMSGYLNHLASASRGVVNGLYISFYYAGGALGVYLPGHLYRLFGWWVYVGLLLAMLSVSLSLAWRLNPVSTPSILSGRSTGRE